MLVEDFVYSGTLSIINPYSPVYHVVQSDSGGMIPASLKAVLSQWGAGEEAEPERPKVISSFSLSLPSALSKCFICSKPMTLKAKLSEEIKI